MNGSRYFYRHPTWWWWWSINTAEEERTKRKKKSVRRCSFVYVCLLSFCMCGAVMVVNIDELQLIGRWNVFDGRHEGIGQGEKGRQLVKWTIWKCTESCHPLTFSNLTQQSPQFTHCFINKHSFHFSFSGRHQWPNNTQRPTRLVLRFMSIIAGICVKYEVEKVIEKRRQ